MATQDRMPLVGVFSDCCHGLAENNVAGGIVQNSISGIGCFRRGVFGVCVVDVEAGAVVNHDVGHANRAGINDRHGVVAAQVETSLIP